MTAEEMQGQQGWSARKRKRYLILIGVLVLYIAVASKDRNITSLTVTASLTCEQFEDNERKKCVKWGAPEAFTIAINLQAAACSVMHESPVDNSVTFRTSESLSYINDDNWECRDKPVIALSASPQSKGTQMVYQMSKGKLSIFSEDLDRVVGMVEYQHLQRKSGLESWLKRFF